MDTEPDVCPIYVVDRRIETTDGFLTAIQLVQPADWRMTWRENIHFGSQLKLAKFETGTKNIYLEGRLLSPQEAATFLKDLALDNGRYDACGEIHQVWAIMPPDKKPELLVCYLLDKEKK